MPDLKLTPSRVYRDEFHVFFGPSRALGTVRPSLRGMTLDTDLQTPYGPGQARQIAQQAQTLSPARYPAGTPVTVCCRGTVSYGFTL